MKIRHIFLTMLAASAWSVNAQVIIDTEFKDSAAYEKAALPASVNELPLKAPTAIGVTPPSAFEAGTETQGPIRPPYALAKVEPRDEEPTAPANLHVKWDLKDVPLEPGRYQLTFKCGILDALNDAGNISINLLDAEGKPANQRWFPKVAFGDNQIRSTFPKSVPFMPGELYEIKITLDTEQMTWSSSVNDEPLREELPIEKELLDSLGGACRIGGISYFSVGGADNSRPGSSMAILAVKFEHLK